jgi:hypothetical protein
MRMGRAEKGSRTSSGVVKIATAAPMTSSGAVSPIALERERMVPVRIPGSAAGRTWWRTACHLLAPRA